MPTLAERIQAALERHTAEVASILASASMAEVIAFTQSKGAVASPLAAVPPEPAGPPDDRDPDGEVRVRDFVLDALRLLQDCRGSASATSVLGKLCPTDAATLHEAGRRLTSYLWKGEKVVRRVRDGGGTSFEITNRGRDMVAAYDEDAQRPQESEPKPAQPPKWAVRRAEDESLALGALKFLAQSGGSARVSLVVKAACPNHMSVRDFSRRVTTLRKHKGDVICRTRLGGFIVLSMTESGKQWLEDLGIPIEQAGSDTVSKIEPQAKVDERAILEELKAAVGRGEKLHRWDEAFLSSYRHEIGLGLPGQEAAGVAYHATEQENGPRPCGIQYGVLLDDTTDAVKSALEGIPDPGLSLAEVVRKTGRFINAIDMRRLAQDGVVSIKGIQGTDYYSLAPKAEEMQEEGVVRQRMEKVVAWIKDHPWSSRDEIFRGTGVTSRQISDLDSERPIHACREWKEKVEYSRKRGKSGQFVKVYALRGTEPWRQKRGPKTNKLRERLDEALAWLSLNPGSTLSQIADGIGVSYEEFRSARHNRKANRLRWQERVEVAGIDKTSRGRPEELLRVKA